VFAENGFDLVISAEDQRLEKAAADFQAMGVQVKAVKADLATYDGVKSFWSDVESMGRPVDAAAVNAGVGVGGLFAETDLDEEINLVRLNVEGTVHLTKRVVQHMVKRGQGRILITASIAGEMVAPREAVYAASKAFDLSFAKSLRVELDGAGGYGLLSSRGHGRHPGGDGRQEGVAAVRCGEAGIRSADEGREARVCGEPDDQARRGGRELHAGCGEGGNAREDGEAAGEVGAILCLRTRRSQWLRLVVVRAGVAG